MSQEQQLYDQTTGDEISPKTRVETVYLPNGKRLSELDVDKYDVSALLAKISQISNPNLLINPDFKINQRGSDSYTDHNKYTLDRWLLSNFQESTNTNVGTVSVSSNGIQLTGAGNKRFYIMQKLGYLPPSVYTFSAKLKVTNATKGNIYLAYVVANGSTVVEADVKSIERVDNEYVIVNYTFELKTSMTSSQTISLHIGSYDSGGSDERVIFNPEAILSIDWVKLEVGNMATPFSPPDIASELLKCKRYYQRVTSASKEYLISRPYYVINNELSFMFTYETEMRIPPTSLFENISDVRVRNLVGDFQTGFSFSFANTVCNEVRIRAIKTSHALTDGNLLIGTTSGFSLDAEIYA